MGSGAAAKAIWAGWAGTSSSVLKMRLFFRTLCPLLAAAAMGAAVYNFYDLQWGSERFFAPARSQHRVDVHSFFAEIAQAVSTTIKEVKPETENVEELSLTTEDYHKLLIVQTPSAKESGYTAAREATPVEELLKPLSNTEPHKKTFALSEGEVEFVHALVHSGPYTARLERRVGNRYYLSSAEQSKRVHGMNRHSDARFFRGDLPLPVIQNISLAMFHEITDLLRRHGIAHWMCCGALIGYHWSGNLLPWDDDVDLQMMAADVYKLRLLKLKIEKYATLHGLQERYLIDVNPYHIFREYQHMHTVDVKITDTKCGYTMDIMAVHPVQDTYGVVWNSKYPQKFPHPSSYVESSFSADALFPTQPCTFQGIETFCPHNVPKFLVEDYGSGVLRKTKASLFGYEYDPESREFEPIED